jgi:hypothetical protein
MEGLMVQAQEIAALFTILREAQEHADRFENIRQAALQKLLEIERALPNPRRASQPDAQVRSA